MLQEEGCKEETCYKGNKLTETACVVSGGGGERQLSVENWKCMIF